MFIPNVGRWCPSSVALGRYIRRVFCPNITDFLVYSFCLLEFNFPISRIPFPERGNLSVPVFLPSVKFLDFSVFFSFSSYFTFVFREKDVNQETSSWIKMALTERRSSTEPLGRRKVPLVLSRKCQDSPIRRRKSDIIVTDGTLHFRSLPT